MRNPVHRNGSTEVGRRMVGGKLDSGEVEPFDPGHDREGHRSRPAAGSGVRACHITVLVGAPSGRSRVRLRIGWAWSMTRWRP